MKTLVRSDYRLSVVDGVTMRSALEARWATFFGVLRLKWRYEPEKFKLGNGWVYTPDFLVENLGWIEIKPTVDHLRESWKRLKRFVADRPEEKVYALCSDRVRLSKNEMLRFHKGKIELPTEAQMYQILSEARNATLGIGSRMVHHAGISAAITTANQEKIDHMVPIIAHLAYSLDRIIPT